MTMAHDRHVIFVLPVYLALCMQYKDDNVSSIEQQSSEIDPEDSDISNHISIA